MIETEESKKISNEQLDIDIHNTELERQAYGHLDRGFSILAKLPENAGAQASLYHFKAQGYAQNRESCAHFLEKLRALKAARADIAAPNQPAVKG